MVTLIKKEFGKIKMSKETEIAERTLNITTISVILVATFFIADKLIDYSTEVYNRNLLAESLMIENNLNLNTVEGFNNKKTQIKETDEIFIPRFSTIIVEEAIKNPRFGNEEVKILTLEGDKKIPKIKTLLRDTHAKMVITNDLLDALGNYILFENTTYESFIKQKARHIDFISKEVDKIEQNLFQLNQFLVETYNVTVENIYE